MPYSVTANKTGKDEQKYKFCRTPYFMSSSQAAGELLGSSSPHRSAVHQHRIFVHVAGAAAEGFKV